MLLYGAVEAVVPGHTYHATEGTTVTVNMHTSRGPEHEQVRLREVGRLPKEDATRPVCQRRLTRCEERSRQCLLQLATVRRLLAVQHHQVNQHAAPPPVLMRNEQLPEGGKALHGLDRGKENRPVARDSRCPQMRL